MRRMTLGEWLDTGIGRTNMLASYFNITPGAITQWRTNGVPRKRMFPLLQLTAGEVSLEEMLPRRETGVGGAPRETQAA